MGKVYSSAYTVQPEAAPEATDEIWVGSIKIGSQNRVTIPLRIIEQAERINGMLMSKRHKFRVSPVFLDGEAVECFLFKDGAIVFTMIGE